MGAVSLVEHLVKLVVAEPQAVRVEEVRDRYGNTIQVRVSPNDVGRLIGKDGRVISCIRQIAGSVSSKSRVKAGVKVVTD